MNFRLAQIVWDGCLASRTEIFLLNHISFLDIGVTKGMCFSGGDQSVCYGDIVMWRPCSVHPSCCSLTLWAFAFPSFDPGSHKVLTPSQDMEQQGSQGRAELRVITVRQLTSAHSDFLPEAGLTQGAAYSAHITLTMSKLHPSST